MPRLLRTNASLLMRSCFRMDWLNASVFNMMMENANTSMVSDDENKLGFSR